MREQEILDKAAQRKDLICDYCKEKAKKPYIISSPKNQMLYVACTQKCARILLMTI